MVDFSKEIADERMELNVGKNMDECLVVNKHEMRQELYVNANKAKRPKGPSGFSGIILITCASQLRHTVELGNNDNSRSVLKGLL